MYAHFLKTHMMDFANKAKQNAGTLKYICMIY